MNTDKTFTENFFKTMCGAHSPWFCSELPSVEEGEFHTVLYEIPNDGNYDGALKVKVGEDKWDLDHVKMPCSDHNVYTVEENGKTLEKWDLIKDALSKPIRNSNELMDAILIYQSGFKDIWKFKALHKFFNEYWDEAESANFFDKILPEVVKLALLVPDLIKSPIPLLKQGENKSISLTQMQLASLFANAFFCTFPERNSKRKDSEYKTYPPVNFNSLYDGGGPKVMEKLKCICHYLTRICTEKPNGVVTFSRRHVPTDDCPDWGSCSLPISSSKYIGGGVLRRGAVQEEIRFVSNPELIVSLLFTEVMTPTEAAMIIGSERFSTHTGYSMTFKWSADYKDDTPKDSSGRKRCAILALDARRFQKPDEQYCKEMVDSELNKAYSGFSFYTTKTEKGTNYPGIATGNWGCGAFGGLGVPMDFYKEKGNARLKSLLQLMACIEAGRPIAYYTFGDVELKDDINKMYEFLIQHKVTVGKLYKHILEFCDSEIPRENLYLYLKEHIKKL